VAIIFLVIIVRVILHPITKKTQVNMVKMQKNMGRMQPRIEEIKKKYANDNRKIQEETMKVYREEGINPVGQMAGCLPMLLQMPIWVALYSSLSNNVAMRCQGFVWWINDLTRPDNLFTFSHPVHVPLLGELDGFHLLPILVGITMFAQQKLMPKPTRSPSASSSQQSQQAEQMQKMMPYMSLVMIFLFYRFPSGLNLYIMTSSLFGALEQWYIRKHIKKSDLDKPAGPRPAKPNKPRKAPSFLERIAKQAEEAQRLPSKRDKKKKK
jgi:YidC/Oxa1 family membrane protein insertase